MPLTGTGAVEGAVVAVDMIKKMPIGGMLSLADNSDGFFSSLSETEESYLSLIR